jgi:ubiquitin C-terminal hydrolase
VDVAEFHAELQIAMSKEFVDAILNDPQEDQVKTDFLRFLNDLGFGQLTTVSCCRDCQRPDFKVINFSPMPNLLALGIPDDLQDNNRITALYALIRFKCNLGNNWTRCDMCGMQHAHTTSKYISTSPTVLIVQINCAENEFERNGARIDFPLNNFVPNQGLCAPNQVKNITYDLFAGIFHAGKNDGGHFTAVCKMKNSCEWCKYDNTNCEVIKFNTQRELSQTTVLFMSTRTFYFTSEPVLKNHLTL